MDNQHTKIRGYRDLNHDEIDLMNELKVEGERIGQLLKKVEAHLIRQHEAAGTTEERERIALAEPRRWLSIGKTGLQRGLMDVVRAVAQPGSF